MDADTEVLNSGISASVIGAVEVNRSAGCLVVTRGRAFCAFFSKSIGAKVVEPHFIYMAEANCYFCRIIQNYGELVLKVRTGRGIEPRFSCVGSSCFLATSF